MVTLIVLMLCAHMTLLVTILVGFLIIVLLEVPFFGVVFVMCLVILAVAQTLLVGLVFRIILVVLLLWQRRSRNPRSAPGDTDPQRHCRNPHTLLQIRSHSHKAIPS